MKPKVTTTAKPEVLPQPSQEVVTAFNDLVYSISLAQRQILRHQITVVQKVLGIAADYTARKTSAAGELRVTVNYRDGDADHVMPISEAAALLNKSTQTLHVYLSKGGGKYITTIEEDGRTDIVTVSRLNPTLQQLTRDAEVVKRAETAKAKPKNTEDSRRY